MNVSPSKAKRCDRLRPRPMRMQAAALWACVPFTGRSNDRRGGNAVAPAAAAAAPAAGPHAACPRHCPRRLEILKAGKAKQLAQETSDMEVGTGGTTVATEHASSKHVACLPFRYPCACMEPRQLHPLIGASHRLGRLSMKMLRPGSILRHVWRGAAAGRTSALSFQACSAGRTGSAAAVRLAVREMPAVGAVPAVRAVRVVRRQCVLQCEQCLQLGQRLHCGQCGGSASCSASCSAGNACSWGSACSAGSAGNAACSASCTTGNDCSWGSACSAGSAGNAACSAAAMRHAMLPDARCVMCDV
eukprot:359962-Chlamydomonas_euryale.AAC.2